MILSLPIFQLEFSFCFEPGSLRSDYPLRIRQKHHDALAKISHCNGSDECSDRYACPYHSSFDQMVSNDPLMAKRHQKPPLPFAWQFTPSILDNSACKVNGRFSAAGRASFSPSSHIESLLLTFKSMSGDGILLERVDAVSFAGDRLNSIGLKSENHEWSLLTISDLVKEHLSASKAVLEFYSPLKLIENGKSLKDFDFNLFARGLIRRSSAIFDTYSETVLDYDYNQLITSLSLIKCRHKMNYRSSQGSFSGLVGNIELQGELDPIISWLQFGEFFNAGKGAGYGMGGYKLNIG